MTVAMGFATVKAFLEENGAPADMVAFIEDRAAKAVKNPSSKKKVDNSDNIARVTAVLERIGEGTVSTIQAEDEVLRPMSTQKVTAVLREMCASKTAHKVTIKGKSVFRLGANPDEDTATAE